MQQTFKLTCSGLTIEAYWTRPWTLLDVKLMVARTMDWQRYPKDDTLQRASCKSVFYGDNVPFISKCILSCPRNKWQALSMWEQGFRPCTTRSGGCSKLYGRRKTVRSDIMFIHRRSSLIDLCDSSQACTVMHVLPSTQPNMIYVSTVKWIVRRLP